MSETERQKNDLPLLKPNKDGNVWPKQSCPAFCLRNDTTEGIKECGYCVYAEFHLKKPKPLDVGICNWPKKEKPKNIFEGTGKRI